MAALSAHGVSELFTLSGGHIFPIYDAAVSAGMPLYDVRHEQTATFAAEGIAKLRCRPGVAALTAGPGVTNGVSAITSAHMTGSPLVVLGGRAPVGRWGQGSLQELDHVPIVDSVTKLALTAEDTGSMAAFTDAALAAADTAHRGPTFVDYPMDTLFGEATVEYVPTSPGRPAEPDPMQLARAAALLAEAHQPAAIAGTDVHLGEATDALLEFVESNQIPTFVNGLGRGCLPADHQLAFSRTRGLLKSAADVVVVIGTALDFRLSFGRFGEAKVIHLVDSPEAVAHAAGAAVTVVGGLAASLEALAGAASVPADRQSWVTDLRDQESALRGDEAALLEADSEPILPTRIYGEARKILDRDAIVVGDGGDFVSYAGRYVDSFQPGCWLDPGPYGCLGTGLGYAMAARVAHPDRQVIVFMGDGAAGFSLLDVDSLVRHKLPVVIVVGNNGCWGLEKHPMQAIYGYDVAADLQPACRYDQVVAALGGAGEMISEPDQIAPALRRGFDSGVPYLINVLTDPGDAYPRRSNLG
jgi:acetolactate synthase-1/2/3 large subunit